MLKDRILAIIDFYKLNPNKFSQTIGMSRAFIKNMNDEISTKPLRNILLNYPEINIIWLLTGEGEMLNVKSDIESKDNLPETISPSLLIEYLKEKDKAIGDLREEIGRLKQDLESANRRKRINSLDAGIGNVAEEQVDYNNDK